MYIIEVIVKKIRDLINKKKSIEVIPLTQNFDENKFTIDDYENCEHVFMPIDSSNETLACSKCGFLIKKEDLPKYMKNPFTDGAL